MHWLYLVGSHLVFALGLPFLLTSSKLRRGWNQRMGRDLPQLKLSKPRVWLHGASAGDLLALRPIIAELKARNPAISVVASSVTESGREMAERKLPEIDVFIYLPFDLALPVNRVLDWIEPDVLVLEYTELWPQLTRSAADRSVDLILTNGRLSPGQVGRYRMLFALVGNPLKRFSRLLMRSAAEAERAIDLGALPRCVEEVGSTKYDNLQAPDPGVVAALRQDLGLPDDGPVWICGSTHEGEEEPLLEVFKSLRRRHPQLSLILAPRYTERCERVAQLVQQAGFEPARRSQGPRPDAVVWILDQVGELASAYGLADLVFVGGSFVSRGGQNILEPAACAKPVLFGPRMDNFVEAVELLLGRGGIQVDDYQVLEQTLDQLLSSPARAQETGRLAADSVAHQRGAAAKCAAAILDCLAARGG